MKTNYPGRDLEAMHFAVRYHRWIFELMRPKLGKRIAEVGAGRGSFSEMLLDVKPEVLTLIEPSGMYEKLIKNPKLAQFNGQIRYFNNFFPNVAAEIKSEFCPDSVVYVNVLEHIEDDLAELKCAFETLAPGGRIFIFVPAMEFLYSEFDRELGHYRRYSAGELKEKMRSAGFEIAEMRWFDSLGILPWLITYRLFGSLSMNGKLVALYDNLAVPVLKTFENRISVPFGKNLLAIGVRKS
ncbi:MAG: class I SAM-dependent methyltransferase [Pyrinomonadaceae bacterium]